MPQLQCYMQAGQEKPKGTPIHSQEQAIAFAKAAKDKAKKRKEQNGV